MGLFVRKRAGKIKSISRTSLSLMVAGSLVCLLHAGPAQAGYTPAVTIKNLKTIPSSGIYTLGYYFTTDFDRTVQAVGLFSSADDHTVGIWDVSNINSPSLIWQRQYLASDPCVQQIDFCWHPVDGGPSLTKQVPYLAAVTWGEESVPAGLDATDLQLFPGFQLNNSVNSTAGTVPQLLVDFEATQSLYVPDETNISNNFGFFGVNLSFEAYAPSKVPAPLPVFGAAAAFGWSRKLRRRVLPSP